jgi:hypothetical protein
MLLSSSGASTPQAAMARDRFPQRLIGEWKGSSYPF